MYIEELRKGEEVEVESVVGEGEGEKNTCENDNVLGGGANIVILDAKRVFIGAGARALFYPTLLYNVLRNKIQTEFRWWDRVDEFILLGAVPFPADVPRLKELGVQGVITLNEPYETLVPSSLYRAHDIDHLVIPTRDYCFAPSMADICLGVDFIQKNASHGGTTYVHCKAGRGRSTTIVICYLVQHKQMTPDGAYEYLRSIRPRVLLASSQRQAVHAYYHLKVKKKIDIGINSLTTTALVMKNLNSNSNSNSNSSQDLMTFDDGSVVVVTKTDLEGYNDDLNNLKSVSLRADIWADLKMVCRVKVAGQAALARISYLWLRCHAEEKIAAQKLGRVFSVDIHVF